MNSVPNPTVSIIIPCYNTSQFVGDTLASVFAQTRIDFETIVINDGSPDTGSLERVIAPYRDRIVYLVQENRGVSAARNTGIRVARGEYIAFLDSDDMWEPDYLAVQLAELERDPSIDVLYPDATIFGDSLEVGRRAMDICPSIGEVTFARIVTEECNVCNFATVRRDTAFRAGLFDESLRGAEDFDLWLRIAKIGGRFAYHRTPLVCRRQHRESLSANTAWMFSNTVMALEKAQRTLPLTSDEHAVVARALTLWRAKVRLAKGRQAFFRGDAATAVTDITEANRYFQKRKLALVVLLLRTMPRLLSWGYNFRDRVVFRINTRV